MNTDTLNLEWLWAPLGIAIGYLVRLIFDRRKLNAENKTAELESDNKALDMYERFANQLNPKIESLQTKIETLTDQVFSLREENATLKIENKQLKSDNVKLQSDVDKMHNEIQELRNKMSS